MLWRRRLLSALRRINWLSKESWKRESK
jgi:hypothetical protein